MEICPNVAGLSLNSESDLFEKKGFGTCNPFNIFNHLSKSQGLEPEL